MRELWNIALRAPDGEGAGGGAAGTGTAAAPSVTPAAAGAAPAVASAPAAADAPKVQSVLDTAAPEAPKETPEQAAERLKAETPEAKTAREAKEKADGEKVKADRVAALDKVIKLPEGIEPDQPLVKEFKDAAADLGLDDKAAQALVDKISPQIDKLVNEPIRVWQKQQGDWIAADKADPEFGGADFAKNMGIARQGLESVLGKDGADEFLKIAAFTGAGNSPAFVRLAFRLGKMHGEGSPAGGGTAPQGRPKALGEIFYPSSTPQGGAS